MDYLVGLNENQKKAVTSFKKFIRINAGAGSGKTKVLSCRIAYLIENFGVDEKSILAITFTNKASKEMKERVNNMLNRDGNGVLLTTYHSFCARVLREDIRQLEEGYTANFTIIDDEDQRKIVRDIMKSIGVEEGTLKPKEALNYIANHKCQGYEANDISPLSYDEELKVEIYQKYEKYLRAHNYLDFDDLLIKVYKLFRTNKNVRYKWSHKYSYILVDEFQDTNDIQYALLRYLIHEDTNVFVVGDPDQTIYTWRGANVKLIMNFNHDFDDVEDIVLDRNYRSTQQILDVANTLIDNNTYRLKKNLYTDKVDGERVEYFLARTAEDEANYVVNRIIDLHSEKKVDYSDIAVLYRSNYYTRTVEQLLMRNNMPYKIFGGVRFYQRKEVKDVLAYLRLATNPNDDQALLRIINEPRRGIGDKTLERLSNDALRENRPIYEIVKENVNLFRKRQEVFSFINAIENFKVSLASNEYSFDVLTNDLLEDLGYFDHIKKAEEDEDTINSRLDNIQELCNILIQLQGSEPNKTLQAILQEIALYSAQDDINEGDYVSLMTIHTAKGLEFKYVFVIGMCEGVFPNQRCLDEDGIEEERRLCYVAFTRAKEKLVLTGNDNYNFVTRENNRISRFVDEVRKLVFFSNKRSRNLPGYFEEAINFVKEKEDVKEKVDYQEFANASKDYYNGCLVEHVAFKKGIVIGMSGDVLEVAFENSQVGVKKISKKFKGLKVIK